MSTMIEIGRGQATDSDGIIYPVVLKIEDSGYIPDVYVYLPRPYTNDLYDDRTFVKNVVAILKAAGYEGKTFDRAELGMQGKDYIVLEPGSEFNAFAESMGFSNLGRQ
jgi:hypothetical protein